MGCEMFKLKIGKSCCCAYRKESLKTSACRTTMSKNLLKLIFNLALLQIIFHSVGESLTDWIGRFLPGLGTYV